LERAPEGFGNELVRLQAQRAEQLARPQSTQSLTALRIGAEHESLGLVVIETETFRVRRANPAALHSLHSLALKINDNRLPDLILSWLRQSECDRPARLELPGSRFVMEISSVENLDRQEMYLVLTERATSREASRLEALGLTKTESVVLHWIAEGKTSKEIGAILGSAFSTVDKHAERILVKLGVESRAAAAAEVRRWDRE